MSEITDLIRQEPSVNDIPDNELLGRVLRDLARRGRARHKRPLWSVVSELFALGSGYSCQLCRRFGLDPDQMVRR
jgi:hypothetical protein